MQHLTITPSEDPQNDDVTVTSNPEASARAFRPSFLSPILLSLFFSPYLFRSLSFSLFPRVFCLNTSYVLAIQQPTSDSEIFKRLELFLCQHISLCHIMTLSISYAVICLDDS